MIDRLGACLLLLLTFSGCEEPIEPALIEPGISTELALVRSQQLSKINYDLKFDIPESTDLAIAASLTLGFDIDKSVNKPLIVDFSAPVGSVKRVHIDDQEVDFRHDHEHLVFSLDDLKDGYNEIDIEFTAGETGLNRRKEFIYTLFVPDRASSVFPCFDQPDLKANFKLDLMIPEEWVALSNAKIGDIRANGRQVSFDRSDLMSTYLFSFVAGKFETITRNVGGMEMTMFHREPDSSKVARNIDQVFNLHRHSIDWLEKYTDIPYPFQKFDFALIPSFQYGGMEHVGAIQYRANSLLLDDTPTPSQLLNRARLIAHETAHMWFGDLVTISWFDDVWMKEVFANFMAAKITDPLFEDIDHGVGFLLSHYPAAYSVDRTKGTHPIRQPLENLKQAGSLYGAIIYQKAPIVMKMLEDEIGASNFKVGVQEYLKTYANGHADWEDLIVMLDRKTDTDLIRWSKIWVESAGMPVVGTAYVEELESNTLRFWQHDETGEGKVWPMKFQAELEYDDSEVLQPVVFRDQPNVELRSAKGAKLAIGLGVNAFGKMYGRLDYGSDISLTQSLYGTKLLNISGLERPITRASFYLQLHEYYLLREAFPPSYPLLLDRYIYEETDKLNSELLLGYLQELYWRWMLPQQRLDYTGRFERVLNQMLLVTEDPSLKKSYFKALVAMVESEEGVADLLNTWANRTPPQGVILSSSDYEKMAMELAIRLPQEAEDILDLEQDRIDNSDRLERFRFIRRALSPDSAVRTAFMESLKDEENRSQERWVVDALHYLHHPLRAEESLSFLSTSLELLEEIQLTGDIFFPKRWLDESFWGHSSKEAAAIVQSFLDNNPNYNPRLRNKILQSTDMLFRVVNMHEFTLQGTVSPPE